MADHEQTKRAAQTQQNAAYLIVAMIGVIDRASPFVVEDGTSFLERHAMLGQVHPGLAFVPFEAQGTHQGSVVTS